MQKKNYKNEFSCKIIARKRFFSYLCSRYAEAAIHRHTQIVRNVSGDMGTLRAVFAYFPLSRRTGIPVHLLVSYAAIHDDLRDVCASALIFSAGFGKVDACSRAPTVASLPCLGRIDEFGQSYPAFADRHILRQLAFLYIVQQFLVPKVPVYLLRTLVRFVFPFA